MIVDLPTSVYICHVCDHAQSPDLPDLQRFYDSEYRISLGSDDHDQLYAVENGKPVYRTDKQAQIALDLLNLPTGSRILDYGAAKAATLRKIKAARPDLEVYVFDVSDAYRPAWRGWLDEGHTSTHYVPEEWSSSFDAVTAHFVIEHIADPRHAIATMVGLLKPGGKLLVSAPDPLANSGDLIVVDHINHFSARSLHELLTDTGARVDHISKDVLSSALVAIAVKQIGPGIPEPAPGDAHDLSEQCKNWTVARQKIAEHGASVGSQKTAIYGAGFYGALIYSVVRGRLSPVCFLDNNTHIQGTLHFGLPVLAPSALPEDVSTLFVGLNPAHAKSIFKVINMPGKETLDLIFI